MREFVGETATRGRNRGQGEEVEEEKPQAPQVDWAGLQAINQDIIASFKSKVPISVIQW